MTEIEALTAEVKALREVQAAQTETLLGLAKKINDVTATTEALNFFAHSVAQSHQDMTLLLAYFHNFVEAAEKMAPQQTTLLAMRSLGNAMIQTIKSQSHPPGAPD